MTEIVSYVILLFCTGLCVRVLILVLED